MDLSLYGGVVRRFWKLLLVGVLLACALALFAAARVSAHGISYRKPQVWGSHTLLLLTQKGFPWGRTVFPASDAADIADPSRLSGLADLYSQFASSDQVTALMRRRGAPTSWKVFASPIPPTTPGVALPVVALSGEANSARDAVAATSLGTRAFLQYVQDQQQSAAIPASQRVNIQILQRPTRPVVVVPRKKTLPIIVFLAVLTATIGLAFVLENLRPSPRAVLASTISTEARTSLADARRTA